MRRVIKNILITFMIIFTILSILESVVFTVKHYVSINAILEPIRQGNISEWDRDMEETLNESLKNEYGEDTTVSLLACLMQKEVIEDEVITTRTTILVVSAFLGIAIGTIISLTKKSKLKEILIFLTIGIGIVLVVSLLIQLTNGYDDMSFIDSFMTIAIEDCIKLYWMHYTAIYIILYIAKYLKGKNSAKKLNKELDCKNKKNMVK